MLAADDILVNAIAPGPILAPPGTSDEERKEVEDATPLGRWGDPRELGGAAIYFASEASSYCNGQVLTVDGGMVSAM